MSHRKRASRSGPLPDISSTSIRQLSAMPAEVLRLHLVNHHLITTGTKFTMGRRLFDAIHSASSAITTPTAIIGTSSASITTFTPESTYAHHCIITIRVDSTDTLIIISILYTDPTTCNIPSLPHSCLQFYTFYHKHYSKTLWCQWYSHQILPYNHLSPHHQ